MLSNTADQEYPLTQKIHRGKKYLEKPHKFESIGPAYKHMGPLQQKVGFPLSPGSSSLSLGGAGSQPGAKQGSPLVCTCVMFLTLLAAPKVNKHVHQS